MRRILPKPERGTRVQSVFDTFVKEVETWKGLQDTAREHANAANRQKTVVNNACKELIREGKYGEDVEFHVGDSCFRFATSESEVIPAADVLALYEKNEITREQFLACISVSKTEANKHIGADRVTRLAVVTKGKKADMRVSELDAPAPVPKIVLPSAPPPVPVTDGVKHAPLRRKTALSRR